MTALGESVGQRPMIFESAARTHVGRVRSVNEDRLLDRSDRGLWAIADGMGGHSAGDAAAAAAIAGLETLAEAAVGITPQRIAAALQEAGRGIATARGPDGQSGTTIVAAQVEGDRATITWAGDSRCYLLRDGGGRQLTRDHSVVQDLIDAGLVAPQDAERHPHAHVITRALGIDGEVALDTVTVVIEPGDHLLLCSDGLSRSLVDRDLAGIDPVDIAADRLLRNALQRDGGDNISLVLVSASVAR